MTYIWFWMSKTLAEIFLVAGFIGIVAGAVVVTALVVGVLGKLKHWRR